MLFFSITEHENHSGRTRYNNIDDTLIIRIGKDDVQALTQLYNLTERVLYAYILSIIQKPADAAEIVQETYFCVRRSSHLYVPTRKPMVWLLNIARNLTNDYFRIHKRLPLMTGDIESDPLYNRIPEITDRIILTSALGILRSEERQVLFLHAAAGLRHREISSYLSIPISTVFTRYNHSVSKLKRHLSDVGIYL